MFQGLVNSDRYMLVYQNADHEVAPNPPPPLAAAYYREYYHYAESAWDNMRLNNVNQHFVTAFLGKYLKGLDYDAYLNIIPYSNDGLWVTNPPPENTPWKGFTLWAAYGMEFHHLQPQP